MTIRPRSLIGDCAAIFGDKRCYPFLKYLFYLFLSYLRSTFSELVVPS